MDGEIAVALKSLANFLRSLEMSLINYEINFVIITQQTVSFAKQIELEFLQ